MKRLARVIEHANNPLYPLPSDYWDLTADGQRQARINGVRQWTIPHVDPEVRAYRRVSSLKLWDTYYLQPDEDNDFDPQFYDMTPSETPEIHWEMARMWARYRMNLQVMPRGCAKSTSIRRDDCMCLVTHPAYSIVYATSNNANAQAAGNLVRAMCYENERIQEDFAHEYSDRHTLRPARGDKPTGANNFHLLNGSQYRVVSAKSKLRGLRPRRFRLDDPEFDPDASTSMEVIRSYMEQLIFKVITPMVLRKDVGVDWIGTFVSKRHYLWTAFEQHEENGKLVATDPRFDFWSRMNVPAVTEQNGKLVSCWPHMWPADEEERDRLGADGHLTLPEIKKMMGAAAFNAEMLGRPGEGDEQYFQLDTDVRGRHAWWVEGEEEEFAQNPWTQNARVCIREEDGSVVKTPANQFLRGLHLFTTVDTAYTEKADSDRRVCNLLGIDHKNRLFVLDMWSDQKADKILLERTFRMCEHWGCRVIHPEAVKESWKLVERFREAASTKMNQDLGVGGAFKISPLKPPPHLSKEAKIASLDLRFERSLIKLPLFQRYKNPSIKRLVEQIEGFTPDARDGGLSKDDELDTVSMGPMALRGRLRKISVERTDTEEQMLTTEDAIKMLGEGKTQYKGLSLLHGVDLSMVPSESVARILSSRKEEASGGTKI